MSAVPAGVKTTPDLMLQFFEFAHLPEHLQRISQSFAVLAHAMVKELPRNPERTTCLRKLLEAKDCAVRAKLYRNDTLAT